MHVVKIFLPFFSKALDDFSASIEYVPSLLLESSWNRQIQVSMYLALS